MFKIIGTSAIAGAVAFAALCVWFLFQDVHSFNQQQMAIAQPFVAHQAIAQDGQTLEVQHEAQ